MKKRIENKIMPSDFYLGLSTIMFGIFLIIFFLSYNLYDKFLLLLMCGFYGILSFLIAFNIFNLADKCDYKEK